MKRLLLVLLVLVMILTNVFTFVSCDTHGHDHETESSTTVNKPTSPTEKHPVGQTTEKNDGKESEKTTQAPVSDTESETKTETKKEETETESSLATESDTVTSAPTESETYTETEEATKKETESASSSVTESDIPTESQSPTETESDEVTEPVTEAPTVSETESETKTEAPTETDDGATTENNGTEPCEHSFGKWTTTLEPTCKNEGISARTCTKCGDVETKTLAKADHKGGKATCNALAICDVCSKPYGDYAYHKWTDATCTSPKSCSVCSATEGEALGHKGGEATCTKLAVCEVCSQPYGTLADHVWLDATCTEAQKCNNCTATKGDPLDHFGGNATCTALAQCERCGSKYGELADHVWIEADCDTPRHCDNCDAVEGEALAHTGGTATCTELAKCENCGKPYGELADHEWKDATCTDPKRCGNCSAFEGEPAGHKGGEATCTSLAICDVCFMPYGELAGHEWIDATCTYPKHCDNCSAVEGEALGHTGGEATCTALAICETCGKGYGSYLPHVFNCQNTDPIYIVSEADCDNAAVYHYSCACGLTGEETFTYGSALGHSYTYISNGDGTHTYVCVNDETHTGSENCSGGEATCIDKAVCDFCKEEYGEPKGHDWNLGGVPLSDDSDGTVCTTPTKTNYYCPDCGATKVETTPAPGHKYTDTIVPPTCAEKGYTSHVCSVCGDSYIDNETEQTNNHSWDKDLSCTSAHTCTVCSTTEAALGHSHKLTKSTEATCTSPATETYKCERCDDFYVVVVADALGHNIEKVTPTEEDMGNCLFVQHYECKRCKADVVGETVEHHRYVASIENEATCQNKGTKKYVCSECGNSYKEAIPSDPANHVWDDGVAADGKIVYTCTENGCGQTKSVLDASDKDEADVNVSDLASGGIEFNEATLDVSGLTGSNGVLSGADNVTLSAGTLKGELLDAVKNNLTDEEKEQLGNNPIFNFTLTNGDEPITNFGSDLVTVTIPYKPTDDEDVDCIAVWYMSGTELVSIEATYNNGFVTFETNHFSYYTVTRLNPKQRCALYGCVESEMTVAPTCTSDGYTLVVCVRCAKSYQKDVVAALGHDYASETHEPDCTNAGKTVYTCKTCSYSYEDAIPATGHTYETTTTPATCSEYGTVTSTCECGYSYTELIPKLPHTFKDTVVDPTCDEDGYTLHECTNDGCDYSYTDSTVSAKGHELKDSWSWSEDYSTATVTLKCEKGCGFIHSEEIEATIRNTESTCLKNGKTEYTTKYVYNGVTYSDSYTVKKDISDHDYETIWKHNKHGHWHKCKYCSGQSELLPHEFNTGVVTKAATCVSEGVLTKVCVCGETVTETIPVSTEHRYVNRFCVDCGAEEPCAHKFDGGKITTEPTCKEEGVKTYTCFICGDTQEEKIPTNDHHTYGEGVVTVEPTCMGEGEMTYTCIWCGATHTEIIDSLKGHLFDEGKIINEPSCTYTGYMEYTCERCGETKGEIIPSLGGHKYDEGKTEREPECLKDGLIVYTCENCGETKSKIIPSLGGHKFDEGKTEIEAGCETDGLFVYTCEVCGERKTEVIDSLGGHKFDEGKVKYEPSCEKDGLLVYTCKTCGETLSEAIPSLGGHKFDNGNITKKPTCVESGIKTFTCEVCGETKTETLASLGGHKYDGGKVTKEPTCADSGIMTYTCTECGNTKTEKISATGEHHYVGGVCDVCGHVNGECDHTAAIDVIVDLADYGACGGIVTGKTCECGAVTIVDLESLNKLKCKFESLDHQLGEPDGNTQTMYIKTRCLVCGLVAETYVTGTLDGCTVEMDYTINITVGSTEVIKGWKCVETQTSHQMQNLEVIDLSQYTSCGGTVEAWVCNECGEILSVNDIDLNCKGEFTKSEITDDYGNLHYVMTMTCTECGMVITSDEYTVSYGDCTYGELMTVTLTKDGSVAFEFTNEYYYHEHDLTTDIIMNGDTCSDGYTVKEWCSKCDYSDEYSGSGHRYTMEEIELPICGGAVTVERCTICKNISEVYGGRCNYDESESYDEPDENGVMHRIYRWTCNDCGITYERDSYSVALSECVYVSYQTITYSKDGEILLNLEISNVEENHSYENEYILKGESCHDGVTVNSSCTVCGDTHTETIYGHVTFETNYQLSELGGCDGWISVTACPCGEEGNLYWRFFNGEYISTDTYTDADGILHTVDTYTCACKNNCTTIVADRVLVGAEECYEIINCTYSVTVNGEEIVSDINTTLHRSNHTYGEAEFTLMGETCEDGVSVHYTCTKCGSGMGTTYYYHETLDRETFTFTEVGACDSHFFTIGRCACGKKTELSSDLLEGNAERGECEKCGLVITNDKDIASSGCNHTEFVKVTASINGTDTVLYESSVSYTEHSFTATLEVSEDLSLTLVITCANCGETERKDANGYGDCEHSYNYTVRFATLTPGSTSCVDGIYCGDICRLCGTLRGEIFQTWNHQTSIDEIIYDHTTSVGCGGYVYSYSCPCGAEKGISANLSCSFNYEYSDGHDENGNYFWREIGYCENCGIQTKNEEFYEKDGCDLVRYRSYSITVNGTVICEEKKESYREECHDFQFEYTMLGKSCTDGIIVREICADCGLSSGYEEEAYYHYYTNGESINFFEIGACSNHYYYTNVCLCGQHRTSGSNIYDELDYDRTLGGYVCHDCGMIFNEVSNEIRESCKLTSSFEVQISVNGKDHVFMQRTETVDDHNFELEISFGEDGALTVTRTCANCDKSLATTPDLAHLTDHDGEIYFDLEFTPEKDGKYILCTFPDTDIYVTLYTLVDGELTGDYETSNGHYPFFETLKAGTTYVFRIGKSWGYEEITVPYLFGEMDESCRHENTVCLSQFATESKNCNEGVYTAEICKACGSVESYRYVTYHDRYFVEKIDLGKLGACGGASIHYYECPCGQEKSINLSYNCSFEHTEESFTDEYGYTHNVYTSTCPDCSFTYVEEYYTTLEGCYEFEVNEYTVILNGETVKTAKSYSNRNTYHDYEYRYELMGDSCEDGVNVYEVCTKCGKTYFNYSYYGHESHGEYVWLDELGACGGSYYTSSCACGKYTYVERNFNCNYDSDSYTYIDEATGIEHSVYVYTCSDCGLVVTDDIYETIEGCYDCYYTTVSISIGDTVILPSYTGVNRYGNHHDYDLSFSVTDGNCENGYTVTGTCTVCGETYTGSGYSHDRHTVERYDLSSLGLCDGTVSISTCACGQNKRVDSDYSCNFETQEHDTVEDSDGGYHNIYKDVCAECGLTHVSDRYEIKVGCLVSVYYTVTVSGNGLTLVDGVSYRDSYWYNHNNEKTYTMNGESCEDGVTVTYVCSDCGNTEEDTFSWHSNIIFESYDLSLYGACGGTLNISRCPCGYSANIENWSDCWTDYEYDEYTDELGRIHSVEIHTCPDCGLVLSFDRYDVNDGCKVYVYMSFTASIGDEVIAEVPSYFEHSYTSHDYVYSYEMFGESCEDGYVVHESCSKCGISSTWESYDHGERLAQTVTVKGENACGGSIKIYSCACGEYSHAERDVKCDMRGSYSGNTDENGVYHSIWTYTCSDCGFVFVKDTTSVKDPDACLRYEYTTYSATLDGEELFTPFTSRSAVMEEHDTELSFKLYGESCEDGYLAVRTCKNCDYYWETEEYYHSTYTIFSIDLREQGFCGGEIIVHSCACGKETDFYWDIACDYTHNSYEQEEDGIVYEINEYTCDTCGLKLVDKRYTVTEGCYDVRYVLTYAMHGDELITPEVQYDYVSSTHHNYDVTYELYGSTCTDGLHIVRTCSDCGYSYEEESYDHYYLITETVELSECGGYVEIEKCPCGEKIRSDWSMGCFSMTSDFNNYVDELGNMHSVETSVCETCGLIFTIDEYSEKTDCVVRHYRTLTAEVDGKITLEPITHIYSSYTSHNYKATFGSEVDNCEDGVEIIHTCTDCGDSYSYITYSHNVVTLEKYDLTSFGACRGTVTLSSCACGKSMRCYESSVCGTRTSNQYYDDEGRLVTNSSYSCDKCGLRLSHSYYTVKDSENCILTYFHTYIVTVGSQLVCNLSYNSYETSHDYAYEGVLDEGAFDCTDGVTITETCRDCGYEYSYRYTHHYTYPTEVYVPSSVCGGEIKLYSCACGSSQSMSDISNLLCDFDYKSISPWVEGALERGYYETEYSSIYVYSNYGIYTCAVTDPQCAYKIRYAEYYIYVSDCIVQRFETFQFGYDEETGSYDKEITIARGSKYVIHNYTYEDVSETYSDGSYMEGAIKTCTCGAKAYTYNYYTADGFEKKYEFEFSSPIAVNRYDETYVKIVREYVGADHSILGNYLTLDSEERRYYDGGRDAYTETYEYDFTYAAPFGNNSYITKITRTTDESVDYTELGETYYEGYHFITYEFSKFLVGTADEYWTRYDHTYNFVGSCTCTTHLTSSRGEDRTWVEEAHRDYYYTTLKAPTCTQYGKEGRICPLCESVFDEYEIEPTAHYWDYVGNGLYRCSDCGLENINGASGEIVMEDLTDEYGQGKNYVVGYWNRGGVEFLKYVSIVLHTPLEDGNDEIILTGIEFTSLEDVVAISFAKEAVENAALELGYSAEDYDVRFTFVPEGSDGSFDYAITFTDN